MHLVRHVLLVYEVWINEDTLDKIVHQVYSLTNNNFLWIYLTPCWQYGLLAGFLYYTSRKESLQFNLFICTIYVQYSKSISLGFLVNNQRISISFKESI
jgi:hypothetical protein